MPGIVAIITKMPRVEVVPQLVRMLATLRHESSYNTGVWIDESCGMYVGWVERAATFAEGMPLRNETGELVLAFSGEEFPEPLTARRLKSDGHEVDIDSASYLIHLAEEDPSFPASLNGRFHGVLVNRDLGLTKLFNDRYGMHRLYYHESKDAFYCSAEAKAILAVCPQLRQIDWRGLGEFVSCGAVLENRTLFNGIHVLPPGSSWVFRNGSLEQKGFYFQAKDWEEQEVLEPESFYRELRRVFVRNLPRYFAGPQRIAMSLTGGLDTRMILANWGGNPGALPCYTFGSMLRENEDVRVARCLAEASNQPHQVIIAGSEFLSQFSHYAERAVYLADGCVDVGRSPDLYLNERAREIAPVRMTGNYGSEVLRGVRAFKATEPAAGVFSPDTLASVRHAKDTYAEAFCGHPVSNAVFKQVPWNLYGVLALEQTQVSMRSPFLDNDFVRTVFRAPAAVLASNEASLRLIADGSRALLRIPTDRGLAGERNSVRSAISRGTLEFLFKAEYAYDMGMPQWLARFDYALSPLRLERIFLGRHKPVHFRVWYRDTLATYVREMLLDACSLARPHIDRKGLEVAVEHHLTGNRNYTTEIHKVLTLELVYRQLFDRVGTEDCVASSEILAAAGLNQLTTA